VRSFIELHERDQPIFCLLFVAGRARGLACRKPAHACTVQARVPKFHREQTLCDIRHRDGTRAGKGRAGIFGLLEKCAVDRFDFMVRELPSPEQRYAP